jgi:phage terminase large subunit
MISSVENDKIAMEIILQNEREMVSPKFEEWRNKNYTYLIAEGGRGAGAKSWSGTSLVVQELHYSKPEDKYQCLCVREFMNSLAESSYSLIQKTIERLHYAPYWEFTREYIRNKKNGAYFIFRGLRDLRRAEQIKSYEGFSHLLADEASPITMESWSTVIPTLRRKDKRIIVLYNRDLDVDPCHNYFVVNMRPNTSYLHLEPGAIDNPWWNNTTLQADMEADFLRDPDEAEHIWKGLPRKQGIKCVMSRVLVRQAMDRDIENPDGDVSIGLDVARYGDDRTEMYKRKGMKVIGHKELIHADTNTVALTTWDFANRNSEIPILVDVGYNPGVADVLVELGANVIQVNFGGKANDENLYPSAASEMWFDFPLDQADIPDDQDLMNELSTRQYGYDKKNRRMIEPKDEFKKRYKRSPDKADALLLCFYNKERYNTIQFGDVGLGELGL